jgi:hypothetical protein
MKGGGQIAGYGSGSSAIIFFLQDGIGWDLKKNIFIESLQRQDSKIHVSGQSYEWRSGLLMKLRSSRRWLRNLLEKLQGLDGLVASTREI